MQANIAKKDLRKYANPDRVAELKRFFKTGPGEYAEGDKFLGIFVPDIRKVARQYEQMPLTQLKLLLVSPIHEERLLSLFILNAQFKSASTQEQKTLFNFYVKNIANINNWDLVDASAHYIIGAYLADKDKALLMKLAKSKNMWKRRIAMVATFYEIKLKQFDTALHIAEILVNDKHDLIHKVVGWMLREIGKRDLKAEERFLKRHAKHMPRTMLRYAIEKFPEEKRQHYLSLRNAEYKNICFS